MFVTKLNGRKEEFNADKIHKKVLLACEGLKGVSASEIEINANFQFRDGIKTSDIQNILINSARDLISEEEPEYDIVASRLINQQIRKEAYGKYEPDHLYDIIKRNIKRKVYDSEILKKYTFDEIDYFNSILDHSKDDKYSYAGSKQFYHKYFIKYDKLVVESQQIVCMMLNICAFIEYPKQERKKWIEEGYKIVSNHEVSFPSPVMVGLRSQYKRYISCNLINYGDSTESISRANYAVTKCGASRSGVGFNFGNIRGLGASIDNGRVTHTGIIPIIKGTEALTGEFSQQMRGNSGTCFYPFFHIEIEDILVLKNNKGTDETRARKIDHCFQVNKLFYDRLYKGEDITLFFMNDVPDLYDLMGDNEKFKDRYEYYEKNIPKSKKKIVPAKQLWESFKNERSETNRLYLNNLDHFNTHSSFKTPLTQSNLCTEISTIATPLDGSKGEPEIGVCILASKNWGYLKDLRIEVVSEYLVRFLEELIDFQEYGMPEIEYASKKRRTLGIGESDVFHWLAKNKLFYNTIEARNAVHKRMEKMNYYLLKASNKLAKERGACELYKDTKYSDGILSIDTYNKNVDGLVDVDLQMDWDSLRKEIKKYGLRNSTLQAIAPVSNSSRVSNSSPGVEPPRKLLIVKEDKSMVIKQFVPEFSKLKNYYTTAWSDEFNNIDYFKFIAVFQKFVDQSISTNQYADFTRFKNGYPDQLLEDEYYTAYKYGLKTLYYQNSKTSDSIDEDKEENCGSGGCSI